MWNFKFFKNLSIAIGKVYKNSACTQESPKFKKNVQVCSQVHRRWVKSEWCHVVVVLHGLRNRGNKKSCMYKNLGRSKPAKCFNEFKAKSEKQTYPKSLTKS